jgi:hypothetical protein
MPYNNSTVRVEIPPDDATVADINRLHLIRRWQLRFWFIWMCDGCINAVIHDGPEARLVNWRSEWELFSLAWALDRMKSQGMEFPYITPADTQQSETAAALILTVANQYSKDKGEAR